MSIQNEYNRRGHNQRRRGTYNPRHGSWDGYSERRGGSTSGRSRSGTHHRWQPRDKRDFNTFSKFKDRSAEVRQNRDEMNSSYEEKAPKKRTYSECSTGAESEKKQQGGKTRRKRKGRASGGNVASKTNSNEKSIEHSKGTGSSFETEKFDNSLERQVKSAVKGELSLLSTNNKKTVFSSDDSDIEKLKAQVEILINTKKNNPASGAASLPPAANNKQNDSSSSSSSSSSSESSDQEFPKSRANVKKEKNSEDEVICLGSLERIENVLDDENVSNDGNTPNTIKSEICILCENKDHISFNCFTICKNCGEKYHGLKDCPKPPNLSTVLQRLMEFCLRQCRQYNPEQRFDFNSPNGIHLQNVSNRSFEAHSSRQPKASSKQRSSSRESEYSYKEDASKKRKRRRTNDSSSHNSFNQFPFNSAFTAPFSFGSQGVPFGAQANSMNTLLGLAQMLGLTAFNSTNSRF